VVAREPVGTQHGRYKGTPSITWILTDYFQELLCVAATQAGPPPRVRLSPFWFSPSAPAVVVERIT
jgi:hypothetical protein